MKMGLFSKQNKNVTVSYREVKPANYSLEVLFLHGGSFSSKTWVSAPLFTLQRLSRLGYRAVSVDLPGRGCSEGCSEESSLSPAMYLEAVIQALRLDRPVIVSPSMSGTHALAFMFQDPQSATTRSRGFVPVAPVSTESYSSEQYAQLKIPTMVVYGENDSRIGPVAVNNLSKVPERTEVEIKGGGHACYMNNPGDFHKHLIEFLRKVEATDDKSLN